MLISGTALIQSYTIEFSAHGERGQWTVKVKAPASNASECETAEGSPWPLLDEMLVAAFEACRRIPVGARR